MIKVKAKNANTFLLKFRGLCSTESLEPIYLETRFGIHTFFVKSPIVVLVMDKNNVVRQKKIVKPWRVFFWNPKFKRILELPANHKSLEKIKVGEKVVISS